MPISFYLSIILLILASEEVILCYGNDQVWETDGRRNGQR